MSKLKNPERLKKRNKDVEKYFNELQKKYPQWKYSAIVEKVAERFYLSPKTIEHIICRHGIYK
ncbi:MAG: hypothetical protein HPY79_10445 [Bacteroidales bacterium]|nr:hypothetical protein [Bacteroidales bacterium]